MKIREVVAVSGLGSCITLLLAVVTMGLWADGTQITKAVNGQLGSAALVTTIGDIDAGSVQAGGRCTLTTGTPVMTSDVTAAATIYYTPYRGNKISLYNGTRLQNFFFAEMSNATAQSSTNSAGPAVVANNSVYDIYVWPTTSCTPPNSCTLRLTRSPAWSSDTSRGSGAGTAQIDCTTVPGVCTNAVAITNGPAANRGTHVCTVRSNGSATIDWVVAPTPAAGGAPTYLHVWNRYNQVDVSAVTRDSSNSWTHAADGVWAQANSAVGSGIGNRISLVRGEDDNAVYADASTRASAGAGAQAAISIGVDSITAFAPGNFPSFTNTSAVDPLYTSYVGWPGLGYHYIQWLDLSVSGATSTFLGDNNTPLVQFGIKARARM